MVRGCPGRFRGNAFPSAPGSELAERSILDALGGRRAVAIVATHGHNDHIKAAVAPAEATGEPIWLHPDDHLIHPGPLVGPARVHEDVARPW